MVPPIPANEVMRLAALTEYDILNPTAEPGLDRLVGLAARLFDMPHCFVTLVDHDRQYLKSCFAKLPVRETGRDIAFCSYTILTDEVLVVEDTTQDPRFADNPLVTGELGVRFYAGAPLRMPGGINLGSFCLLDMVPRRFSKEDAAALASFAEIAAETIEAKLINRRLAAEKMVRDSAEVALRSAEARFQRVVANSPGMVYRLVWGRDGSIRFPFVSEGCRDIFGLGPDTFYETPEKCWSLVDPRDVAGVQSSLAEAAASLHPWNWSGRVMCKEGETRWVEGKARAERLPSGDTLLDGILLDVTERKLVEQKGDESNRLLRTIIEGTNDAVFIKDRDGRYLLINPAGAAFLGRKPEEVIGLDDAAFFSPETARSTMASDESVLTTGQSHTYEDGGTVNGVERIFLSTKDPYRDDDGQIIGVFGIARDITERKRAETGLQAAKEEADKANRAKSDFLSRMSHELRTPLNAILGFGQLLEMSDLKARDVEGVNHILQGGRHLLGLIDEVLEISRIEAGKMRLSLEPVRLSEVVGECQNLTERLAADRGVTLRWDCELDECAWADRQRLKQVILNLLSNAIKYNRVNGSVTLSCQRQDSAASSFVRVEVTDTGLGLHESELTRLFVPFERLSAENGSMEGTGLGLALSKGLVEAMGGTIGVRSTPGEGSCFWFELPPAQCVAAPSPGEDHGAEAAVPIEAGSVLYIEDNASNLYLIECVLDRFPGIKLHSARQGSLGLEMALSCNPDLILLDLHLPDIPGWEILRRLKADPATAEIPVTVISADATPGQIDRLRAGGAFDYMTKPLDMQRFFQMLVGVFQQPCEAPALAD